MTAGNKSVTAVLLLGLLLLVPGVTWAGGPLFISGDDSDDPRHCPVTACGGLLPKAIKTVYEKSTSPGTGILAIGVNSNNSDARKSLVAWNSVANGGPGASITFVTSTTAISSVNFSLYRMIYVPSSSSNTDGGITQTQLNALNSRKAGVQAFVDAGGGVMSLTEQGMTSAYAWLPVPVPLTFSAINDTNIDPTADMFVALPGVGTTNANMDHCCYHTMWTGVTGAPGTFGDLKILAVTREHNLANGSPGPVILARLAKVDQTITFGALANKTFGDADFAVSATASSGLPVGFTASGSCTVAGTTVHITGAGSCTITASQAGDASYNPAPDVPQTFSIGRANQTITFAALTNKIFGDADFAVSATASSGLPVSFAASGSCTVVGTTVHITGGGSCTITASQAGNANYNPAPDVPRTFSIGTAGQTITFGTLANKTFGDPDFAVSATASSGLPVSFTAAGSCTVAGTTVHITGGGSCTITASQAGDSNYGPAPDVPRTFSIARANQTITFGTLANKTFGDPDFAVSATASSGLPVSFTAAGSCTVGGTTVHITGGGSCTITASQAGNANYNPAPDVPQSFTINTKPEVKTLGLNPLPPQTNDTLTVTVAPFDADGNPVTLTYVWKNGATVVKTTANTTSLTDTLDLSVAGIGSKGDTITVEVTPNDGVIVGNTRSVSVVIADSAPILTVINQTGSEGALLTFQLSAATDSDGDTRTYSASDLPLGATFDQATRTFSWTPTSAQGGPNPYLVRFTVSDGTLTDTKVASITIADTIADRDGDGIPDSVDNCPDQYNPDQADVCHNSPGSVTADATVAPSPPTGPIDVAAIFTFTATAPGTYVVRPNPMNVICRVTDQATQQELKWQTVPEGFPIVLSTTSGDLAPLPAPPFVTTFNLRDWYPDLAPGSYTVVCTYVNFAHIPAPEADDPIIWMGTVDAPAQTILIGLSYVFGGFDSPADHEPFKRGRTVPVKFDLRDGTGAVITSATPRLFVQRLQGGVPVGARIPATPAGGSTGNTMEFGNGGYHYNMATDPLAPGQWQLQAQLGDGTIQVITIIIR